MVALLTLTHLIPGIVEGIYVSRLQIVTYDIYVCLFAQPSVCLLYSYEYVGHKCGRKHNAFFCYSSITEMDPDDGLPFKTISADCFYGKRYDTLENAIDYVASTSHHNVDVILLPPDVDTQTDEEDIDEDVCDNPHFPADIPGEVEVHYDSASDSDDDNIPLSEFGTKCNQVNPDSSKRKKTDKEPEARWTDKIVDLQMKETMGYLYRLNDLKKHVQKDSPVETFERLFDKEILKHIAEQSKLYAAKKNNHAFFVTDDELRIFTGILIFSGYHRLPRERLYRNLD